MKQTILTAAVLAMLTNGAWATATPEPEPPTKSEPPSRSEPNEPNSPVCDPLSGRPQPARCVQVKSNAATSGTSKADRSSITGKYWDKCEIVKGQVTVRPRSSSVTQKALSECLGDLK